LLIHKAASTNTSKSIKERGLGKEILDEHLDGLKNVIEAYKSELNKIRLSKSAKANFTSWQSTYFPEFKEFDFESINF
jgi:hypothetical protein